MSELSSVPLNIISESFAAASIVILPEDVVILTAESPAVISSAATEPPATYVFNLEAKTFLFVPLAPSSIINKSASTMAAPISVPPSISKAVKATLFAVLIVANLVSTIAAKHLHQR